MSTAGLTATSIAGTVTVTEAVSTGLPVEVAVRVTPRSAGGAAAGAVYVAGTPLAVVRGDRVPQGAVGQETLQLTCGLAPSWTRVAVIGVDEPAGTGVPPLSESVSNEADTVIVTVAVTDESACAVAVTVTVRLAGGGAVGAKYVVGVPLAVPAGETLPQGAAAHETVHWTPALLGSLATVATICVLWPANSVVWLAVADSCMGGGLPPPALLPVLVLSPPQAARPAVASVASRSTDDRRRRQKRNVMLVPPACL